MAGSSSAIVAVGTLTRNPYLNFLNDFRRLNKGLRAVEIIRSGAKRWKSLPKETKIQYILSAYCVVKKGASSRCSNAKHKRMKRCARICNRPK